MDSFDFRFLSALKNIKLYMYSPLPTPTGHKPVRVEFTHDSTSFIKLDKGSADKLQVKNQNGITSAVIPPVQTWDLTYWEIKTHPHLIMKLEVNIERIWWSLTEDRGEQWMNAIWTDKPLKVSPIDFKASTHKAVCIWLPKPGWIKKVFVGFEEKKSRAFYPKISERKVIIPFREFCDTAELIDNKQKSSLKLWIYRYDKLEDGIVICELEKKISQLPIKKILQPELINPQQIACCYTCDHARIKYNVVWCRRSHWTNILEDIFVERLARSKCDEWQGEYYDSKGNYFVS